MQGLARQGREDCTMKSRKLEEDSGERVWPLQPVEIMPMRRCAEVFLVSLEHGLKEFSIFVASYDMAREVLKRLHWARFEYALADAEEALVPESEVVHNRVQDAARAFCLAVYEAGTDFASDSGDVPDWARRPPEPEPEEPKPSEPDDQEEPEEPGEPDPDPLPARADPFDVIESLERQLRRKP